MQMINKGKIVQCTDCYCKPMCSGKSQTECKFYAPLREVVGNGKKAMSKVQRKSKGRKANNY